MIAAVGLMGVSVYVAGVWLPRVLAGAESGTRSQSARAREVTSVNAAIGP
jgi:hypothetical protein